MASSGLNLFPMIGISALFCQSTIAEEMKTTNASINRVPPSPCTSMPSTVKWLIMAPEITPKASPAPSQTKPGPNNRMVAMSSVIPDRYLPHVSMPTVSNIYMLSGAPVNLKKSVCNKITAAASLGSQLKIVFAFIVRILLFSFSMKVIIPTNWGKGIYPLYTLL